MLAASRRRALALLLLAVVVILVWLRRRKPRKGLPLSRESARRASSTGFACFLSHFKVEAATEARWLQEALEPHLDGERAFLDSDDLLDLSRLKDHVRESKCLLLLQTRSVLTVRQPPPCVSTVS